jgi:polysaccharide biosynthesis protein PslH
LVPLRVGGGSRIKILEAMASGCPVISTAIGAEGLHIEPGRHFVQADDKQAFVAAAVTAVRRPASLEPMTSAASDIVRARYDWNMLSRRLEQVWQSQVRERELVPA